MARRKTSKKSSTKTTKSVRGRRVPARERRGEAGRARYTQSWQEKARTVNNAVGISSAGARARESNKIKKKMQDDARKAYNARRRVSNGGNGG